MNYYVFDNTMIDNVLPVHARRSFKMDVLGHMQLGNHFAIVMARYTCIWEKCFLNNYDVFGVIC